MSKFTLIERFGTGLNTVVVNTDYIIYVKKITTSTDTFIVRIRSTDGNLDLNFNSEKERDDFFEDLWMKLSETI